MPAVYNGSDFDTALQATWAAFFDLAGWKWRSRISAIDDWKPDFEVTFPCAHSECGGQHKILISVLPIASIEGVKGHPALTYSWGVRRDGKSFGADAGAVFGNSPKVTEWTMAHGSGGGTEDVTQWVEDWLGKWEKATGKILDEN